MGTYYYLFNDTKKHRVDLDSHTKIGPMTSNDAVHYALINYMMENRGDSMRILSDACGEYVEGYEEIDLLKYKFSDESIMKTIVEKLNSVYKRDTYKVVNGTGIDTEDPDPD